MTRKDYLLKALSLLQSDRPMAAGLIKLVENDALNPKVLDALLDILRTAIHEVDNHNSQEKLQKTSQFIQKVKEQESQEHGDDMKDLADLEKMFQDIS